MTKDIIMGIDVGYSHTKVVTGRGSDVFRSTVKEGAIDINVNSTVVEYEGEKYTIGERGKITVNQNKIRDKSFEIALLTGILRNADERLTDINVQLVTGLPIAWYPNQKDELREFLYGKSVTVGYKGKNRNILIKECLVFPQSAGLALIDPVAFTEGKTNLVIDIGGLTVDVSYFEGGKCVEKATYELGMLIFYDKIANKINEEFNVSVDSQDVERFIEEGMLTINEEDIFFDFDKEFKDHMEEIIQKIKHNKKLKYDIVHKKTFVGGGSLQFKDYLPKNKGVECNEIQLNAQAFYNVGVQKFG